MELMEKNILSLSKEIKQIQLQVRQNVNKEKEQSFRQKRNLSKVECFTCHQKGHYQCFCPENATAMKKKETVTNDKTYSRGSGCQATCRLGSCSKDAGMFEDVLMYVTNVKLLVDTGDTVTMLSKA
jgi:hypothetical protein